MSRWLARRYRLGRLTLFLGRFLRPPLAIPPTPIGDPCGVSTPCRRTIVGWRARRILVRFRHCRKNRSSSRTCCIAQAQSRHSKPSRWPRPNASPKRGCGFEVADCDLKRRLLGGRRLTDAFRQRFHAVQMPFGQGVPQIGPFKGLVRLRLSVVLPGLGAIAPGHR